MKSNQYLILSNLAYNFVHSFTSIMPYKKRKAPDDDNINVINIVTGRQLHEYNNYWFFSTYGLFCMLEVIKKGSTGKVLKSLDHIFGDQTIMNILKTNNLHAGVLKENFKNVSLIFNVNNLEFSTEFKKYLKTTDVICDTIDLDKLQVKCKEINIFLEKMTHNMIKETLSLELFDINFGASIINALYTKNTWMKHFDQKNTTKLLFNANYQKKKIDMMCMNNEHFLYFESTTCKCIQLPYAQCGCSMIVVLPNEDRKMVISDFDDALQKMKLCKITKLILPKFQIEQDIDLEKECKHQQMKEMFKANNDFDSMFESKSSDMKKISKIKQKTIINVNESGIEAACVSITNINTNVVDCDVPKIVGPCRPINVNMSLCPPFGVPNPPIPEQTEFVANRPFSFFVMGPNNIALFAGKFYNN